MTSTRPMRDNERDSPPQALPAAAPPCRTDAHGPAWRVPGPERTHAPSALDLLETGRAIVDEVDQARNRLGQLALKGEEPQVATGLTADTIQATAEAWGADLIVIGTQGRQGFTRLVLGCVADAFVRDVDIPVMTVRERRETPEQTD